MAATTRLDAIARGLASGGLSRREALRTGAAALIGAAVITPAEAWAHAKHCPHGHVKCAGKCCPPGEVCQPPKHKGGKHSCGCPKGTTRCSGKCVHTKTDVHNCGHCGRKCAAGESCSAGVCTPHCSAGETLCSGQCVNLQTDPSSCGTCGHACPSMEACSAGQCVANCPTGQANCSGSCVNTASNTANCGSCGHACATNATCVNSSCMCPSGSPDVCSGACTNTMTDASNCGTCGHACSGGMTCQSGTCACPEGQMNCSGTCADLETDVSHCGTCGTACCNYFASSSCHSGACQIDSCSLNWANCSGNPADGCNCEGSCNGTTCIGQLFPSCGG